MKRTTKYLFIVLVGAGLTACSSFFPVNWSNQSTAVASEIDENSKIDSLISPYREGLKGQMSVVIGYASQDLERGRPCSPLNNWAADALFNEYESLIGTNKNCFALLNFGGLRSRFNKGPITIGDVYSFMPFDNNIVLVRMPISALSEVENYLKSSGGEPISNAKILDGKLVFDAIDADSDEFIILTSDYLSNGGDKMTFFEKSLEKTNVGDLLRDVFLNQVKLQDTLKIDNTCRIDVD